MSDKEIDKGKTMKHDELQRPALVSNILERVLVAEPDSPIAVFDHPLEGCLRAVFASTVQSQKDKVRTMIRTLPSLSFVAVSRLLFENQFCKCI